MVRSPFEDFFQSGLGLVVIALFLLLAVVVTPFFLVGAAGYIGVRLYLESPRRLERLARDETTLMYNHAVSGSVRLTDDGVDAALSRLWPVDMPPPLRIQLLEVGRALFVDEGLSPQVPPPPALCNTVEGARYRDVLARMGQARSDRVMVDAALAQIGTSLAVIARAAPPIDGDVLVGITQFLHPLGQAVEEVIAPFFADSDYRAPLKIAPDLTAV